MDRAKKKLASALDGLRNTSKIELEFEEKISTDNVTLFKIARHGFPDDPHCIAYDPVQRLLAIGCSHGCVRIFGNAGVDYLLQHEYDAPVIHTNFLINEGALATVCRDDMVHLWNLRQKVPEVVHSVQMNKEKITAISIPLQSKWLYVGTERGNVYFICIATFALSTYVINWNKAIDLACRTHPGSVQSISACPSDSSKILLLFENGVVVLWNLVTREAERFQSERAIRCVSWHYDGRQFLCGCSDGSLIMWNLKKPNEYAQKLTPHGTHCGSVAQVFWMHLSESEHIIIYSGGMPCDEGALPSLTILRSLSSASVLEMDSHLVQFLPLVTSPITNTPQQPYGLAVLLKEDLLIVDLSSTGYPCFENINPMDLHDSPVNFVQYHSDCPPDLIGALTLVGCKQRRQGYSDKPWPITGGTSRECASSFQELLITGHEDGSVKFWQTTGENIQILYKLKSGRHFERNGPGSVEISHAVVNIEICLSSRLLLVAGRSGQVTLFHFMKAESAHEISVINVSSYHAFATLNDEINFSTSCSKELKRQGKAVSQESYSPDTSEDSNSDEFCPLKVRGGAIKRTYGYKPDLVCLIPWRNSTQPESITSLGLNSLYGFIAIGTSSGLALVDIVQYILLTFLPSSDFQSLIPSSNNSSRNNDSNLENNDLDGKLSSRLAKHFSIAKGNRRHDRKYERTWSDETRGNIDSCKRELLHQNAVLRHLPHAKTMDSKSSTFVESLPMNRNVQIQGSPPITARSFPRLNTDGQSRGVDRHPILSKAYSVNESAYMQNSGAKSISKERVSRNDSMCSSPSSQDKVPITDAVTALFFIHSPKGGGGLKSGPLLWIGTADGTCFAVNLVLPNDRLATNVAIFPQGPLLRLKGQILHITFLDNSFCILSAPADIYRARENDSREVNSESHDSIVNRVLTKLSLSPMCSNVSENLKEEEMLQIAVIMCEEEVRVLAIPGYNQLFSHKPEIPFVKAVCSHICGYPVAFLLNAAGQIVVLSIPTLRTLLCAPLFKHSLETSDGLVQKFSISDHGLGMCMISLSELQKFTASSQLTSQVCDCTGDLFVPMDLPEPQKNSFLKGVSTLFASQKEPIDLDAVFLDKSSGVTVNAMRSIARTILGPSANLERATSSSISAGQAANLALQVMHERGDKLSATVDATERLKDSAMSLSGKTGKLVEKYEKKKWYNF